MSSSFVCLSCGSAHLDVVAPPAILGRFDGGGPAAYVDYGLDGSAVVTQYTRSAPPPRQELRLRFAPLSSSQAADLDAVLNAGGTISVMTTSAASAVLCVAGPRDKQKLSPLVLPYGDAAIGGTLPENLKSWEAEIVLIRLT